MSSRVSIVSDGEPLLRFPSVRADRNELTHSGQLERDEPYALPGRGRCRLSVSRLTSPPTCRTCDGASHSRTRRNSHGRTFAADGAGSALVDPRASQLGALGEG